MAVSAAPANTFQWGGRTWRPQDKAAFAKFLSKRGGNLDAWARNHATTSKSVFGYRAQPRTLAEAAQQQAEDQLQPQIDLTNKQTAGAVANTEGFTKGLADLLGGIGPKVHSDYQQAADSVGALGKGFSDQYQAANDQTGQQATDIAKLAGAPEGQIADINTKAGAGTPGAADVLYAKTGYIPGSTMAREGAAFSSAADQLPAEAAGVGQENVQQIHQKGLDSLAAIQATEPDLTNKILDSLFSQQIQKGQLAVQQRAQGLYEQQFGEKVRHDVAGENISKANTNIRQRNYNLATKKYNLSVQKAAKDGRHLDAAASKGLGYLVDQNGDPVLGPKGNRIKFKTTTSTANSPQGKRDKQYQRAVGEAQSILDQQTSPTYLGHARSFKEATTYLVQRYGLSRRRAQSALVAAGWKPRGTASNPRPNRAG